MYTLSQHFYSEAITLARYDTKAKVLEITYRGGGTYEYLDVPISRWVQLTQATSAGNYVHTNIKGVYSYRQDNVYSKMRFKKHE